MNVELLRLLRNRRWWQYSEPFPFFWADQVFEDAFYSTLESTFHEKLSQGFSDTADPTRFSRNMPYSDAFGWDIPAHQRGPFSVFTSRSWHDMLCNLTNVLGTLDVNIALHHHRVGSPNGAVHSDLGVGWFSHQPEDDGVNVMDLRRCPYTTGIGCPTGISTRQVVRAATMIFYVGNSEWTPGDGGETGLYDTLTQRVARPTVLIPPTNNSVLVFKNTPYSYHSFLSNQRRPRNSLILWVHQKLEEAQQRWGDQSIFRW